MTDDCAVLWGERLLEGEPENQKAEDCSEKVLLLRGDGEALSVGFKSGSVLYPLPEGNGYIRFLPVAKKDQPAVISNSLRVTRQAVGAAGEILCVRRVIEAAPLSVIADKQQAVLMCTPR